jgi:DNA-binding transcriptional MerR regulator
MPAPADTTVANLETTWTIREIADDFGVTHRTVRHYEDLGLIAPERRGTTRVYRRRDRTRLALILRGKRLGFPLEEIRTIIDLYDRPRGKASQLEYVLSQIDDRRADLEQRRRDLDDALLELDRFEERCRQDLERLR